MDLTPLTQAEYDAHIADNSLRIAFVGMSNVGKSYRSKVLRDQFGFDWYQVDKEIIKSLGFSGMEEIAEWLGLPDSPTYGVREREYLDSEAKHTKVDFIDTDRNLVFDTTGSVIYLEKPTTQWLQENCLIVNLEAGEKYIDTMIQKFFEQPKPVVWNGMYVQKRGETQKETLERCFPALLRDRLKKYRGMAHVNVPVADLYDKSGRETIAIIRSRLPA
ncbi:MAG: hypothetical protein AAB790_00625 [Patescibacteria group bacterium]